MTTVQAAKRQVQVLLLPACLAAVILGILGMHAFTHHEPISVTASSAASPAAAPHMPVVSALPHAMGDHAMGDHAMGDMVMLCAAMLLGAAAGVLLALRLARLARTRGLTRKSVGEFLGNRVALRVGTGPPAVWEFSVVRC